MKSGNNNIYEDQRPYCDSEIEGAMKRIAGYRELGDICAYSLPDTPLEEIREAVVACRTADDFQAALGFPLLTQIIRTSMSAFTFGGTEYLKPEEGYLYISNHRDIVLDGALLQYVMYSIGLPTTEITFGSNLVSPGFVEDFGRSNKMFKIVRGGSARDLVQNSQLLSAHLHEVVDSGKSIWISQRDGRTKDGNDRTDQGLVKMFTMDGRGRSVTESLAALHIVPFAISYEYESCDALKAREIYLSRRGKYEKAPGEDMKSILTGIQQWKGEVHLEICEPIRSGDIDSLDGENTNEVLRSMASILDERIISGYKLYATNYIAYDMREGSSRFGGRYTAQERDEFSQYIERQASGIDGERQELLKILLDIYANPVVNKLSLGS